MAAEAALFSLAAKLLSTIAESPFKKAYEKARSTRKARKELDYLRDTISTIQAVVPDAEKKYRDSPSVRNWVERVGGVLHDAEDLFDEVATADLLERQMEANKYVKKVQVFVSKQNPITFNASISEKVKTIREDLRKISRDVDLLGLVNRTEDVELMSGVRKGWVETVGSVEAKEVVGRDHEKKQIINFLFDKEHVEQNISVISIVGIGGMGKSTLAQLVYNDGQITSEFSNRYWAWFSDVVDAEVVIRKIYQSITGRKDENLTLDRLVSSIKESINSNRKFLLVLDNLWDDSIARGRQLRFRLSSDAAKGSKIIVTARNSSVAKAMEAEKTLTLEGLSSEESWELFEKLAFTKGKENDPFFVGLGKDILKKCANVPLAIRSVASTLSVKDTHDEWRSIVNKKLSNIEFEKDPTMSILRLSYDQLQSALRNCFAYCSLFPKAMIYQKQDLINLWIALGYVKPDECETPESAGHAYFMELIRRTFFQDATYDSNGEIKRCKMHDLVHDLAVHVAGEEYTTLTDRRNLSNKKFRHVNVECVIPQSVLKADQLRSCICVRANSLSTRVIEQQVLQFKFLRVMIFRSQGIEEVPSLIGKLMYLRYLNLALNGYKHLPDSITKLVNLVTLDISYCENLVELPRDIGRKISLRHLINDGCTSLREMPVSFGKLTSLQQLSEVTVSKRGGLDVLTRLNLQGRFKVKYDLGVGRCSEDDFVLECGQIPDTLQVLEIEEYPSMRMPAWWREDPALKLVILECLTLGCCTNVEHLPPLRCLPCLKFLSVYRLNELEYMEEDKFVSTTPFFPSLRKLEVTQLPKLKGWSKPVNAAKATTSRISPDQPLFPRLEQLVIEATPHLVSMPPAPHLQLLRLNSTHIDLVNQLLSTSSDLQDIEIHECAMTSFAGEGLTFLRNLQIGSCPELRNVKVAPDVVGKLIITSCPKMELWAEDREEEERSIDWTSFYNLWYLDHDQVPKTGRLPHCLQQLVNLGKLQLGFTYWLKKPVLDMEQRLSGWRSQLLNVEAELSSRIEGKMLNSEEIITRDSNPVSMAENK